jgi:hypothetical protein
MARRAADAPQVPSRGSEERALIDPSRDYTLLCLTALMVVTAVLVQTDLGWWGLLPMLLGGAAVVARWGSGPPVVLLALVMVLLIHRRRWGSVGYGDSTPLTDLLLAWAVLAYVAGHYRLQALAGPKGKAAERAGGRARWFLPPPGKTSREPAGVRAGEISVLVLLSGPLFVGLAFLAWLRLGAEALLPPLDLPGRWWQVVLVVWVIALGTALTAAVLSYLGWRQATPEEALQYLQDQLWAATRGEQRRLNRWLVWARLRRRPAPEEERRERR